MKKLAVTLLSCFIATPVLAKYDDNRAISECHKLQKEALSISGIQSEQVCKVLFKEIQGSYRTACYIIENDRVKVKIMLGDTQQNLEMSSLLKCKGQKRVDRLSSNTETLLKNL